MPQGYSLAIATARSNVISRALARALSVWVKPSSLPENTSGLIDTKRPILYVLETGGLADRTALGLMTRQMGLPTPGEDLEFGALQERSRVVVLVHGQRRGWLRSLGLGKRETRTSRRLFRLVHAGMSLSDDEPDLQVVPVAIYWGRAPDSDTGLLGLLFNENWELAGRLSKLLRTLIHGRNTLVQFSEPLSLRTLARSDNTGTPSAALLTRKLARILRVHFRKRRVATLGPDRSHRRTLLDQVMAEHSVREAISADADSTKAYNYQRSRGRAEGYANEIAANVSYTTISVLDRLLTRLWNELYDGIQLDGIERLQAVADGNEIVYVPCHRSHIDYLLLSFILVKQGFSLPHVAAGVNLNLPVIGSILRRGGAFFLRRSFSGQPLYAAVFNAYLKVIIQRGHPIEYFIEGGRSRTGRLLPARGGMLAMTASAYLSNPLTPVIFVPVYFGYERLVEGRAFTSELAGDKKKKESILGLLRSLKTLRENYGRVHVNFGDPIHLDTLLDTRQPAWRKSNPGVSRPEWLSPLVSELGERILGNINAAASVTPTSLLATVMLASRHGRVDRDELSTQLELYDRLLRRTHKNTNVVVPSIEAIDVIKRGHELGYLETLCDPIGEIIALREGQSGPLTYFRNNILHLLTLPSLIAAGFSHGLTRNRSDIAELVATVLPFLHGELFLPTDSSKEQTEQALKAMEREGLLSRHQDKWVGASTGEPESVSLKRLGEIVMPGIERYYICVSLLMHQPGDNAIIVPSQNKQAAPTLTQESLQSRCADCAERLASTEGRNRRELHDKNLFNQFIDALDKKKLIKRDGDNLSPLPELSRLEGQTRQLLDEGMHQAILRASAARSNSNKTP